LHHFGVARLFAGGLVVGANTRSKVDGFTNIEKRIILAKKAIDASRCRQALYWLAIDFIQNILHA
jgi:hypothetical protein